MKSLAAFVAPLLVLLSQPTFSTDWKTFSSSMVKRCVGSINTAKTGKVKVPKIGEVYGVKHDPDCGDQASEYQVWVTWSDAFGFGGYPRQADAPVVNCKWIGLSLPEDAVICGIRYFANDSGKSNFPEQKEIRNTGKRKSHKWAKKEETMVRVSEGKMHIRALYKNWRRSHSRRFGIEVDFQRKSLYEARIALEELKLDIYHSSGGIASAKTLAEALLAHELGRDVILAARPEEFFERVGKPSNLEIQFSGEAESQAANALKAFLVDQGSFTPTLRESRDADTPGTLSIMVP